MSVVEYAITVFEKMHGVNVCVHDLVGNLSQYLNPKWVHHRSPLCLAVKMCGRYEMCLQFGITQVRKDLANLPEGRVHTCHAGLVEWVVPVFEKEKLAWVLFAGPRLPGKDLASATRMQVLPWDKNPWRGHALPDPVGEEEAQMILEHLRQMAARLQLWVTEHTRQGARSAVMLAHDFPTNPQTTRQVAIMQFIEKHYEEPITLAMLAKTLCLSESRASYAVKQCCHESFSELLIRKRLHVASELLRQSSMSVLEVALSCGFGDVAYFHRIFRKRIGITPAQYRLSSQT